MTGAAMDIRRARSLPVVVLLFAGLGGGLLTPLPAAARTPAVEVSLQRQTAFTTQERPMLRVAVAVTNTGPDDAADLSLLVTFGSAVTSRLSYEQAMVGGPPSAAATVTVPVRGTLDAGRARTLSGEIDITSVPAISAIDSRVYPMRIAVRSGGAEVGGVNTAAVHVVREPETPLAFSWWLGFTGGPAFGPDGTFRDPGLAASLAPGGSLSNRASALRRVAERGATIDIVVQPSLLADAAAMADGYTLPDGTPVSSGGGTAAAAARFLADLRGAAARPGVEVIAQPMYAPTIPSLAGAGLASELRAQQQVGVATVAGVLGVDPAPGVTQPVAGALDSAALDRLAADGVGVILADPDTVDRPPGPLGFAPPPTATLAAGAGRTVTVVLPDPGTEELLTSTDLLADAERAAQVVFGELAVIWKELPNPAPPTVRGLAVRLPSTLPPPVWRPLMDRLATAPFLRRVHAVALGGTVNPPGEPAVLASPDERTFSPGYVQRIRALNRDVDSYRSMQVTPTAEPDRLRAAILQSQAAIYLGANESLGGRWLDEAARVTTAAFEGVTPKVQQAFTLTSGEGTLPIRLGDPGPAPLQITVRLASAHFSFPEGDERRVILSEPGQIETFAIRAESAGRNPIVVSVLAPDGRRISEQTVVVRSTAVSRIALAITIAAGLGLLALYARRWTRRRTPS
jgi:hypothetical protein